MSEKPLVVITGITGYLGSHTCLLFLQDGSYRVRGTVRDPNNENKIAPLKKAFGDHFSSLELVAADLNNEPSIDAACVGATYVIHTASPFHFKGDCVGPAVAGTTAVLNACMAHKVKRCVMTSSLVAVMCIADADRRPDRTFDESVFSNPDRPEGLNDYFKSKTLAERAAWEFQKANPSLELVCINPGFIMGPSICSGDGFSEGFVKQMLDGSQDKIPHGRQAFVDVRDVALAHLRGAQRDDAVGKRFILYNVNIKKSDVYGWLKQFNAKGAKVPTEMAEGETPETNTGDIVINERSKTVLGIEYTPIEKTFVDMAQSMIDDGKI